jgi:hypothetical protein
VALRLDTVVALVALLLDTVVALVDLRLVTVVAHPPVRPLELRQLVENHPLASFFQPGKSVASVHLEV